MASFFQPAVYDPEAEGTVLSSAASQSKFLVYTNSTLVGSGILAHWYQYLVLGLGSAALGLTLLKWLVKGFIWRMILRMRKFRAKREEFVPEDLEEPPLSMFNTSSCQSGKTIRSIQSFGVFRGDNLEDFLALNYDLHIIDLETFARASSSLKSATSLERKESDALVESVPLDRTNSNNIWGLIDDLEWRSISVPRVIDDLKDQYHSHGLSGLVISSNIGGGRRLNEIFQSLFEAAVPCMLLDDAEQPCNTIAPQVVRGIIYRNACILTNGARRDFFQASKLRNSIGRYQQTRKNSPDFFLGFLDLWTTSPLPSVIRRSYKFASFNGAVLHHEAASAVEQEVYPTGSSNSSSAFDWLKRDDIIKAQKLWINASKALWVSDEPDKPETRFDPALLEDVLPGVDHLFALTPVSDIEIPTDSAHECYEPPAYSTQAPPRHDFWSRTSQDKLLCVNGCFDLREELFDDQYIAIVRTQRHLQKLDMLEDLPAKALQTIYDAISSLPMSSSAAPDILQSLSDGLKSGQIKVFRGLDSGFCLPDGRGHFWAVSQADEDGTINLFISLKSPDLLTTIIHAYLAHRGVERKIRFEIEMNILKVVGGSELHPRIAHELQSSSYAELLHLLEQLTVSGVDGTILESARIECERLLIDEASMRAWIKVHSHQYLSKKVSIDYVLQTRLTYLVKRGSRSLPSLEALLEIYKRIDLTILSALYTSDEAKLARLSSPILSDASSCLGFNDRLDLYCLMFFCSLRRHAFEEVYMETTDRCPLFLQQQDQAAVFAELWVLGSQCEIYFGIRPRALGAIIYQEYRDYLSRHPPPPEAWDGVDVFTAYHQVKGEDAKQVPMGSEMQRNPTAALPLRARLGKATFLTIFCVPAIVDVGLLTFLGRGLYLTAFMTLEERVMANYAVLAALIMTAGVTGWSGSSGGFYLYQSAFHNMNHFMVQRLSGGFMLAALLAACGFIAFGFEYSWYAGFIFAAYLIVLSTYLNLLGIMATMHRDGTPFKSGRLVLARCLCITLISPVLTSLINNHDILIYLLVLYAFLAALLIGYTKLCHEWSSWTEKVPLIKEKEIIDWYEKIAENETGEMEKSSLVNDKEIDANKASQSLADRLATELHSGSRKNSEADKFYEKLVKGHPYVVWLLEKESNGQPLPPPYTSTWLVQTKLALTNQQQIDRGLKEHSPFLLFRTAKYDLAQNVGLFLVALLDRWVAVSMSANGFVVNVYYNVRARYGIAFGLLYFLLCAVSLDIVLQRYWGKTGRRSSEKLGNIFDFEATEASETSVEKKRWLTAISELVWVMAFIFGFMTILVWLFVNDPSQIILYFAYIAGYSGVVIFQFNRVFTTDIRMHVQIVFMAAFGGYILGIILHEIPQTKSFRFNDVICLCVASLASSIGTWLYTDFCDDASQEVHMMNEDLVNWKVYSQKLIGNRGGRCRLKSYQLERLGGIDCKYEDNSILSEGIKSVFTHALLHRDAPINATFARAQEMLEYTLRIWKNRQLQLVIVDRKALGEAGGASVFAASTKDGSNLLVYVGMPSIAAWKDISYEAYEALLIQSAAEAMLHESCEAMMKLRHSDSTLAELLLNGDSCISTRMAIQLAWSDFAELSSLIADTNVELERHLAFGIDVNVEWENTHEDVRLAIISRVLERTYPKTEALRDLMVDRADSVQLHDWYIIQCLGIREAALAKIAQLPPQDGVEQTWSFQEKLWPVKTISRTTRGTAHVTSLLWRVYEFLFLFIQFVAVVSTAGTDCGRELWFVLRSSRFRTPVLWFVLKVWKVCWWFKNFTVRCILLNLDTHYLRFHEWATKGASRTLCAGKLSLCDPRFEKTGFLTTAFHGVELTIFEGLHSQPPSNPQDHQIATYDDSMRLVRLVNVKAKGDQSDDRYYHYPTTNSKTKQPTSRATRTTEDELFVYYDKFGRVTHGELMKTDTRFRFVYDYKAATRGSTQVIQATYTVAGSEPPIIYKIYWCRPSESDAEDIQTWAPTSRVARVIKMTGDQMRETTFTYEHKRDPIILQTTSLTTTSGIQDIECLKAFNDEYGLLKKPLAEVFGDEDLLFYHSRRAITKVANEPTLPTKSSSSRVQPLLHTLSAFFRLSKSKRHTARQTLSTAMIRTALWKQWATRTDITGVTACYLDEFLLRREPVLRKYWKLRDAGCFARAKVYLSQNLEGVLAAIEIADEASQKAPLAIKPGDLFVMGLSKDSNFVISEPEETYIDTEDRVAVIFTDTGCWPDAPGGVSNCRRDLVDGHKTVRNYALTESANEFGLPRFQMEKNVQLVKNLPLWGLDGKSPYHGLFDNLLQTQVDTRIRRTRKQEDINNIFVPLLKTLVRGARTIKLSQRDLTEYTSLFLNINRYFDENDYLTTWRSKAIRKTWREAWLIEYDDENILNPNDSFQIERPTASDFDEALELYISYFFIFSVRVPDEVPRVFQSTHHGISSLFGMILKIRRGTTWGIWDHAIMWRESCLNISPAQCILPVAVQAMLLGAMKLASHLAYMHADIILPCTAIYNPIWEAELGTDEGRRSSQQLFKRKIDPITNGISNMEQFQPVSETRTADPTAIMLSNVQFIKDVKNAIHAAGVIINDFGFKTYNLVVYGAQDRQPSYAIETEELINSLGIQGTVKLGGFGSPKEVLKDAWLFMNSSLSEGLPLAIGEAALSGIPIVATEVGATAQVLTDVDDPNILYGEVVPPNDPVSLARAQISLLAMLGRWAKYTTDDDPPPALPTNFTAADVKWITQRMYDKAADRKLLGLRLRDVVQKKFNGTRYLREHEQMYWVQRHMSEQRASDGLTYLAASHPRFGQPIAPQLIETEDSESMWLEDRWQDFPAARKKREREGKRRRFFSKKAAIVAAEERVSGGDHEV
ncbi:MAG: hypothetical protein M1818_001671 [Claussenomyces sp. TS43310]|nr:MAG: hypothetical protein M1818_001671 [Claussenomyces sp. TS43310]